MKNQKCDYCSGGEVLIGETTEVKVFVDTGRTGESRTIRIESMPCPENAFCGMKGIPSRGVFLINFCPMCGRKL